MQLIKLVLIFTLVFFTTAYSACKKKELPAPLFLEIANNDLTVSFPAEITSKSIAIQTNSDDLSVSCDQGWCSVSVSDQAQKSINITVSRNESFDVRNAIIKIKAGNLNKEISVTQLGLNPVILLKSKKQVADFKAQTFSVELTTNTDLEITCSETWLKQSAGTKSAKIDLVDYLYKFDVQLMNVQSGPRIGKIYFRQKGGTLSDSVTVTQSITLTDRYNPELASAFEKDKKIRILGAALTPADKFQGGEGIEKSIDGQLSTLYHSPWSGIPDKTTITLEYALDPQEALVANYVVLHPRTSGSNGIVKSATVWITTEEDHVFKQVGSINAPFSNNPVVVRFSTPVINPRTIKVIVGDAWSGDAGKYYLSLAEFECYESKAMNNASEDLKYFTDVSFSQLQAGTTMADIANIQNPFLQNIAAFLIANKYPKEFRVQEYAPYREVSDLAHELKISSYSQFENMTGMYFAANEEVVVFVGPSNGQSVSLRITDFGPSKNDYSYPLSEGVNILTMKGKGNGYISYYTPDYQSAGKIKVHIASGKVNGYFDLFRHTEQDGKGLLDSAVSEIMDLRGNRTQLAYSVASLRKQTYGRLGELVTEYDHIIGEEQLMMGLAKYNRLPKNHMFGRVIWEGYMHADGWGAAFHDNTMSDLANPVNLRNSNWGIAHEFGHVNQVRPGMKWVGTTECTNNIYSAWVQYCYTPGNLRLEHENIGGTRGGRFNAYLNNGIIKGQEWGLQGGPDAPYGADSNGKWGGDHFVKLAPLWQLQLYYHIAGEGNSWHKPYFWADIFEKVRNTDETGLTDGQLQINFVKNTCDAVQEDLSDFFLKIGMLKIVDKIFDDYTSARKTITQAMIDEAVTYAQKYPKPKTNYIFYISGNSIDAYKYKRQVSGQYNTGVTGSTVKQILHSEWKNVVVFETYAGNALVNITMAGTGSSDNTFTNASYPENATRIEAVGYDGTKVLVFGAR